MGNLSTNSPLSRHVVRYFLDFLNSVEPAPGVDLEGLQVSRDCLTEVFKLDSVSINDERPDVLVDLLSSLEVEKVSKSDACHRGTLDDAPSSSAAHDTNGAKHVAASKLGDNRTTEPQFAGIPTVEIPGQYFAALQKINSFRAMPDGKDAVPVAQFTKATHLFLDAVKEMERSECQTVDCKNLAETFKTQGNRAMQSKLYSNAIELYSIAVSLCEDNAVYYCNRAAAYTRLGNYDEAIMDCQKSIEIDPNYTKAYSFLGSAYYGQGHYADAIMKGYLKALGLDPKNESIYYKLGKALKKQAEREAVI